MVESFMKVKIFSQQTLIWSGIPHPTKLDMNKMLLPWQKTFKLYNIEVYDLNFSESSSMSEN